MCVCVLPGGAFHCTLLKGGGGESLVYQKLSAWSCLSRESTSSQDYS